MPTRHGIYYFEDENVIFQVGDKLFRVQKRLLVGSKSSAFASMFSLPQAQNAEGQTDGRPIILQGDTVEEFEALMRILHPPPLEDITKIPIATYTRAMRVAAKYSMDDVQDAICRAIKSLPSNLGIARLAFIAEFPGHFHKGFFMKEFVQACSTNRRPSGYDLQPLMAFPHLVALMMQYREGIIQPNQAIWNEWAPSQSPPRRRDSVGASREGLWLDEQLDSLGLAPFLPTNTFIDAFRASGLIDWK